MLLFELSDPNVAKRLNRKDASRLRFTASLGLHPPQGS
jgi:hypothetical protein